MQFQLDALQKMNFPEAFAYNSPINQEVTGPWQSYATSLSEPPFRSLLGHSKSSVLMTVSHESTEYVCCLVKVVPGGEPLPEPLTKLISARREAEQLSVEGAAYGDEEEDEEERDGFNDEKMKKNIPPYSMYWWWVSKQYEDEDDDSSDYHYLVDTIMPDAEDMEPDFIDSTLFQSLFEEGDDEDDDEEDDSSPFFFDFGQS